MIIRRARIDELDELRDFFNKYWGTKHAIMNVKSFVNFYFIDGAYLNFIIARETEEDGILSACGYIPSNHTANPDLWTTMWLTKKGAGSNIGLQIINYMATQMGARILSTASMRKNTIVLYKFLRYETAKMEHYYRLSDRDSYKVAVINHHEILPYELTSYSLQLFKESQELLDMFDESALISNKPCKDLKYIINRFYHFPFYNYLVYGIMDEGNFCRAIITMRKVEVNSTSVLRVVDLIGRYDDFAKIGKCIQELLQEYDCEYIDFYCYGLKDEILRKAGFSKRNDNGNIIPSYLEPYACVNTEYYFFSSQIEDFVLFKADGDQDRLDIELLS